MLFISSSIATEITPLPEAACVCMDIISDSSASASLTCLRARTDACQLVHVCLFNFNSFVLTLGGAGIL